MVGGLLLGLQTTFASWCVVGIVPIFLRYRYNYTCILPTALSILMLIRQYHSSYIDLDPYYS